jgi:hypothetical protein
MAIADPKTYAVVKDAEPSMAEILASIRDLAKAAMTSKTDDGLALKQIEMMERLITKTIPENKQHPEHSVYTVHPDGTYGEPGTKPTLRCKTNWCGRDLSGDTETVEEIQLLNRLEPGEYRVTKADGSSTPFKVSASRSDAGKLDAISVWFPCNKEHRQNHMPMASYLRQVLGEALPSREDMLVELTKLRAELERAKAGVVGAV